jgi:hypothetical protein
MGSPISPAAAGSRAFRLTLAFAALLPARVGWADEAAAQAPPQAVADLLPPPAELAALCAAEPQADEFLAAVERARALADEDDARAALDALEPEARRMAAEAPDDVAAQYRLAAVMGAQLDHESGADKMSGAEKVRDQATRVLALEPAHPGASYMLGRIHASVLRLGGFKRFLANTLFGGGALQGASWEDARALLEIAVRGNPCVPDHHWELARAYAARDDADAARRQLAYLRELTVGGDRREARLRERADELEREL